MANPVLITKNISKNFGKFSALDNINITIEENSCVGLLGPNGAGKTTLIKILTNLIRPSSGTAQIFGHDVTAESKKALGHIGTVVETPEFFPYLTPNEVLNYFGKLRGIPDDELDSHINKALESTRLENVRDKRIGTFSKGMKQRMGIASAILHNPELLILDEPTSGFDPRGKIEMREIFKNLLSQGKTILISSHQLSEIQEICDSVAILDNGKLVDVKRLDQIKNEGKQKIEIKLLASPTATQMEMIKNLDGVQSLQNTNNELHVEFEGSLSDVSEFLKKLSLNDLQIISFNTISTDLESLYLDNVSESIR